MSTLNSEERFLKTNLKLKVYICPDAELLGRKWEDISQFLISQTPKNTERQIFLSHSL